MRHDCLKTFQLFKYNYNNINYIIDIIVHLSCNLKQLKKNPSKTGRLISWSVNHNPVASCFRVLRPRCISDRPLWLVQIGGHRTVDVMDMEWHGDLWDSYIFSGRKHKWLNGWLGVVTITLLLGILTPFVRFIGAHLTLEVGGSLGEAVVDEMIISLKSLNLAQNFES